VDDELRRLLRARDLSPEDAALARRAATLAGRRGERTLAVESWQEVLRRAPRDEEAERRLEELGCELRFVRVDAQGLDELESTIDGATLVRAPVLAGLFVARQPVSYAQFHRFLAREGGRAGSTKWIGTHGPLRRTALGPWSFRGGEAASESYVTEASWLGADAYAKWAGGRLLTAFEWVRLAEAPTAFEGFDRNEGEWVDGERTGADGARERPFVTLWDARFPPAAPYHERWAHEDVCGEHVLFRYVRDSWFHSDLRENR
jgi:hypothetical protein